MAQNTREKVICNHCRRDFANRPNLLRHQRTSCKEKPPTEEFECEYCKKILTMKTSLDRHMNKCPLKNEHKLKNKISKLENCQRRELKDWKKEREKFNADIRKLKDVISEKDREITELKIKCESSKIDVYTKVCDKVLNKSTVTTNTNTAYIHPKLVNLPITNIHPLTEDYVKERIANGGYTFDHYLRGENGLVDFIYSITMCENSDGDMERNFVCTDPSRDSYHRLVETKEWEKDRGGKFVDIIFDTLSGSANEYHMKVFDQRAEALKNGYKSRNKLGYDPDYIYKLNTDMHSGIVSKGKDSETEK